jgi:hypothetical protein
MLMMTLNPPITGEAATTSRGRLASDRRTTVRAPDAPDVRRSPRPA